MKKRKFYGDQPVKDLHILCSEVEHSEIKSAAAISGFTLSRYCTKILKTGQVEARMSPSQLKLCRDLVNLGTNLNQIARKLNSLETDKITVAMAEEAVLEIHKMLSSVQNKNQDR